MYIYKDSLPQWMTDSQCWKYSSSAFIENFINGEQIGFNVTSSVIQKYSPVLEIIPSWVKLEFAPERGRNS